MRAPAARRPRVHRHRPRSGAQRPSSATKPPRHGRGYACVRPRRRCAHQLRAWGRPNDAVQLRASPPVCCNVWLGRRAEPPRLSTGEVAQSWGREIRCDAAVHQRRAQVAAQRARSATRSHRSSSAAPGRGWAAIGRAAQHRATGSHASRATVRSTSAWPVDATLHVLQPSRQAPVQLPGSVVINPLHLRRERFCDRTSHRTQR